jgi:hypothetical protein
MDTAISSPLSMSMRAKNNTATKLKFNRELSRKGDLLDRYLVDLEDSWVVRFMLNVGQASQEQHTSSDQLDSFMNAFRIHPGIEDTINWRAEDPTYALNEHVYNKRGPVKLYKDLLRSTEQILEETFSPIYAASELKQAALCELDHRQIESSVPSLGDASSVNELADVEVNIVHMLLTKLWIACQDPRFTLIPEDGTGDGSKGQEGTQKSRKGDAGGEAFSRPGQKHSRQNLQAPDSENEDEDGDPEKSDSRKLRITNSHKQTAFPCPFFKHDPQKHGERRGCRQYSQKDVGVLLRVSDFNIHDTMFEASDGFYLLI